MATVDIPPRYTRGMLRGPMRDRVFILVLLVFALLGGCSWPGTGNLRIAAGTEGSAAHRIGAALTDVFNAKVDGAEVRLLAQHDSHNPLQQLLHHEADLAVAFSDTEGDGDIRTLVPLYELYLYIIVWQDADIADVPDLKGRRIGLGPAGSGTDTVARRLLQHYRFGEDDTVLRNDGHRAISMAFLERKLDAVFILGSTESNAVERMLKAPGTKLLSLDDPSKIAPAMDGIRAKHPFVVSHVVPKHLFGDKPKEPTGVIGVHSLLVARADLPDDVARALTRAVFAHRVELSSRVPRLRELDERFDVHHLRFPLHPGASQYYRRDEPPAILGWAPTISLFISVIVLGWSAVLAFAASRRRRRKTAQDEFYAELSAIVGNYDEAHETAPDQMSDQQLDDLRDQLQALRRRAFSALMAGSVTADSAFVIFHDYLRWELQDVERLQRDRRKAAGGQ